MEEKICSVKVWVFSHAGLNAFLPFKHLKTFWTGESDMKTPAFPLLCKKTWRWQTSSQEGLYFGGRPSGWRSLRSSTCRRLSVTWSRRGSDSEEPERISSICFQSLVHKSDRSSRFGLNRLIVACFFLQPGSDQRTVIASRVRAFPRWFKLSEQNMRGDDVDKDGRHVSAPFRIIKN